jgi:hypothetical protein
VRGLYEFWLRLCSALSSASELFQHHTVISDKK